MLDSLSIGAHILAVVSWLTGAYFLRISAEILLRCGAGGEENN